MKRKLATAILFASCLSSCSLFYTRLPMGEIPPIQGDRHTSPLGVTVYVPTGMDGAPLCLKVDAALEEWIVFWAKKESLERVTLLTIAKSLPAVLYDAKMVANRDGFCKYGSHVGIALQGGYYDTYFEMYLGGIRVLIHEWTHILKGAFHEE